MLAPASHVHSQRKTGTVAGYQKDDGQGGGFIASDDDDDDGGGGAGAEPQATTLSIRKGDVSKCLNRLTDDGDCKKCRNDAGDWQYTAPRKKRAVYEMADSSSSSSSAADASSSASSASVEADSSREGTGGEEKRQRTTASSVAEEDRMD